MGSEVVFPEFYRRVCFAKATQTEDAEPPSLKLGPLRPTPALEQAADGETAGITDAVDLAETLEIQEGLRIMTDWLALSRPTQTAAVAKEKNPDTATSVK